MTAEAFPLTETQREAVARQNRRRKILHTMAAKDSDAHGARLARKLLAENVGRLDSPVDVARRTLQRRGFVVYSATVIGGKSGLWIVGPHTLTTDELIAKAAA